LNSEGVDVVIIGGGLAGSCLALQLLLAKPSIRLKVIERISGPLPEAAFKVGESTVEIGAHYFANVLGLKDHLETDQLRKLGLRYFFNGDRRSIDNRLELGGKKHSPTKTYQLDRGRFENFLRKRILEQGGEYITPARVKDVELSESGPHKVQIEIKDQGSQEITCRWVVDASGRNSFLKRRLELQKEVGHKCSASWFRVKGRFDLSTWSNSKEWKSWEEGICSRWYSTNHLMGDGYWVWLIPLASGFTSVGIVAAQPTHEAASISTLEKSMEWLHKHEPQCAQQTATREVVDFLYLKQFAHGCKQVFSAKRWALSGEAGVFLDPFYSPGSDFIAIGNSFIADLVLKDLASEPIEASALIYNQVYLRFFEQMLLLYQDQYPIFGNPAVMPLKIVWDFAIYWSYMAAIFFEQHLTDIKYLVSLKPKTDRIERLNSDMQLFFREWSKTYNPEFASGSLSFFRSDYLIDLSRQLLQPDSRPFEVRIEDNIKNLEHLAKEICEFAKVRAASAELIESIAVFSKPASYSSSPNSNSVDESNNSVLLKDFLGDLGEILESRA
jgi:flavin-dependent dehydrogenase